MEAAGLAVGVVPLVVGALKAYRAVYQYLRVFRHYAAEIRTLSYQFEVQKCILEYELDKLLQKAAPYGRQPVPPSTAELLKQETSAGLVNKIANVDGALRKLLSKHTETFTGLLVGITEQLRALQTELKCFDAVKAQQTPGESMRQTVSRVKARLRIGFDKRRLRELLDALKSDNEDLRSIRSYITDGPKTVPYRNEVKSMPTEILSSRAVILALHESLSSCWTCADPAHGEHVAKLCLDPVHGEPEEKDSEVRLDLAVTCRSKATMNTQLVPKPIWLYVRTTTEISPIGTTCRSAKRLKVGPQSSGTVGQALLGHDSVCESLSNCSCNGNSNKACLSYLNSGHRHLFFHHCNPSMPAQNASRSLALADLISEVRTEMTMDQQLALARRLVLSALELYKSPWLPGGWRTNDISSFSKPAADDNDFTRRLHVTSTISGPKQSSVAPLDTHWAVTTANSGSDAMYLYGINNNTLFSLGVALLEIAHGKPLEHFRKDTDPNLFCTAQRLVQRACPLGERYRELARQCLRCDFGCGAELELRGLQDAVYTDVVGRLDGLMNVLRI